MNKTSTLQFIGHVSDMSQEYDIPTSWCIGKTRNTKDIIKFKDWKHFLFSPWSDTSYGYTIEKTQDDLWKCCYYVIVYDGVEASMYALGETPSKALNNIRTNLMKLKLGIFD